MKLAIGTAQFGMRYGLTNQKGLIPYSEIENILLIAKEYGIDLIDTAYSYGESEKILGEILCNENYFKIVTKIPYIKSSKRTLDEYKNCIDESMQRLKRNSIYALLVHSSDVLKSNYSDELWDYFLSLKNNDVIDKIGVSIYELNELVDIVDKYNIDLIQVPCNILDQRIFNQKLLYKIKQKNIEVHARSIFLQGVLLLNGRKLPVQYEYLENTLKRYCKNLELDGVSAMDAAIGFVDGKDELDYIVVGVTGKEELTQIYECSKNYKKIKCYEKYSILDEKVLDPRCWGKT